MLSINPLTRLQQWRFHSVACSIELLCTSSPTLNMARQHMHAQHHSTLGRASTGQHVSHQMAGRHCLQAEICAKADSGEEETREWTIRTTGTYYHLQWDCTDSLVSRLYTKLKSFCRGANCSAHRAGRAYDHAMSHTTLSYILSVPDNSRHGSERYVRTYGGPVYRLSL
jgi:hypothetical protein